MLIRSTAPAPRALGLLLLCALASVACAGSTRAADAAPKKLKVFIMAGQSNMEGHAEIRTVDSIGKDPLTAPLLKEMRNADGTPRVCDKVWMSYLTGPYDGSANGEGLGQLTAGFGERENQPTKISGKIGPEFTFGISMEKALEEPILIIKTAWGGRSLNTEFRPPSAGPYVLPKEIQEVWDKYPQGAHGVPKLEDRKKWQEAKDVATAHPLKADGTLDKEWKWENHWKPVGKPLPEERTWRFTTIAPTEQKDKLQKYDGRRFRDITLPAGMENWFAPDFDDSQWTGGKAPIGKGVWKHGGITLDTFPSAWGEGEFLLMRTTLDVEDLDCESYRIAILARQAYHVYLNGQNLHTYIWWSDAPRYGAIVLNKDQTKVLKKGKNVLAVYANDQYDEKSPNHHAAIDVWIEGITKAGREKLDLALEEVLPPKDREALEGASNGGYHYWGSATIFAQMGKAFGEALLPFQK